MRLVSLTALLFVSFTCAVASARIVADNAADEATYQKAILLLKDVQDRTQQSKDLFARAAKSKSAEESAQLKSQATELLDQSKKALSEARALMQSIAPPDRPGHALAHLWVFDDLYRTQTGPDGKPIQPSPQTILECERHLLQSLKSQDEQVQTRAHFGLAKLYQNTNRIEDAKKHLAIVAEKIPEYRLILAQYAKAAGEKRR